MNDDIDLLLNREGLKLSTIQSRAAALGIDEILLSVLLLIILWGPISSAATTEAMIGVINTFVLEYMTIKIIYQTFFTMQYGATLGKIVMKIRVVEVKTLSNPTLLSAFNRSIFRIASELVLYFGFIWGMLDPYKRTWHDFTARTLVVDV
jgi:uncharacterized RDD family membrane protein YckC